MMFTLLGYKTEHQNFSRASKVKSTKEMGLFLFDLGLE
jgi:hypothetical protein